MLMERRSPHHIEINTIHYCYAAVVMVGLNQIKTTYCCFNERKEEAIQNENANLVQSSTFSFPLFSLSTNTSSFSFFSFRLKRKKVNIITLIIQKIIMEIIARAQLAIDV